jgi:hypothetical protein
MIDQKGSCLFILLRHIEAPCSKLQRIFDPQGRTIYSNRSLTPQQVAGNALAPGFNSRPEPFYRRASSHCRGL